MAELTHRLSEPVRLNTDDFNGENRKLAISTGAMMAMQAASNSQPASPASGVQRSRPAALLLNRNPGSPSASGGPVSDPLLLRSQSSLGGVEPPAALAAQLASPHKADDHHEAPPGSVDEDRLGKIEQRRAISRTLPMRRTSKKLQLVQERMRNASAHNKQDGLYCILSMTQPKSTLEAVQQTLVIVAGINLSANTATASAVAHPGQPSPTV